MTRATLCTAYTHRGTVRCEREAKYVVRSLRPSIDTAVVPRYLCGVHVRKYRRFDWAWSVEELKN